MDAQAAPLARWRAKPRLEESIQTLEHLFVDAPNVRETAPKGEIQFLSHTLEFRNELLHQTGLITVLLPKVLLANVRRLFLPVLGS